MSQVSFSSTPPFPSLSSPPPIPSRARHQLAFEVEQVLRDNLRTSIDIDAICKAVGVSERTLHAAFRAQFGTSPMSYLKNLRLDAVRADLRRAQLSETVTQIAIRWGFLHFGWFAHDYQLRFGELPSQTLRQLSCDDDGDCDDGDGDVQQPNKIDNEGEAGPWRFAQTKPQLRV
jgi:transcriptional regulator GlxA family with amidase domain